MGLSPVLLLDGLLSALSGLQLFKGKPSIFERLHNRQTEKSRRTGPNPDDVGNYPLFFTHSMTMSSYGHL